MDSDLRSLERAVQLSGGSYWARVALAQAERRAGLHNSEGISAAQLGRIFLHNSYDEETDETYSNWVVQAATEEEETRACFDGLIYFYNHTYHTREDVYFSSEINEQGKQVAYEPFGPSSPHPWRCAQRLKAVREGLACTT